MKKLIFKGCGTAIVTPFNENGVDLEMFKKLINFQIQNNADSIIVCGTTGESSTMTKEEKLLVIETAVKVVNKKVPIIVGTGSNDTKKVLEMNRYVKKLGADGVLIVTPYYNKTTQNGLIMHYKKIAENTTLPIILYNVPSRTGVNILPETCLELSKISNIVGIKEASGNISQITEIAHLCKENLSIYSGNDDQILPILSIGGKGVISVFANINPKYVHDICYNFWNGNYNKSLQMQLESLPLIKSLFLEVNPIPIKSALKMCGFDVGKPRLPLIEISEKNKEILKNNLECFNQQVH